MKCEQGSVNRVGGCDKTPTHVYIGSKHNPTIKLYLCEEHIVGTDQWAGKTEKINESADTK